MPDYWRNITYLAKYVDHEMIEKAGFAKLEYRKGNLKGNIQIKDEINRKAAWKAYIGYEEKGTLFLTLLGVLNKNGNNFVLEISRKNENIKNRTLVLIGRRGEYCSESSLEHLILHTGDSETEQSVVKTEPKQESQKQTEPQERQAIQEPQEPQEQQKEQEVQKPQEALEQQKSQEVREPNEKREVQEESKLQAAQKQKEPQEEPAKITESAVESKPEKSPECKEKHSQNGDWVDKLLRTAAGMYPFHDNELNYCVRIEPKDFGLLPAEDWALGSNSFLLNGYYSYRHILFGVKEGKGKRSCYIGVPGTYHRREIFMAKMFGFSTFKGVQNKKTAAIGDFGYWMMEM